jgi:hypothetical protein
MIDAGEQTGGRHVAVTGVGGAFVAGTATVIVTKPTIGYIAGQ